MDNIQTNFDHIKKMSVEEMAKQFIKIAEGLIEVVGSDKCRKCEETHCTECVERWLLQEVSDNG